MRGIRRTFLSPVARQDRQRRCFFPDVNLTNMQSTTRKSVEFRRAMEPENQAVRYGANAAIAETVRRKLA